MANTIEELHQLQALPLDVKVKKTEQRIHEWVDSFGVDGVYIAYSGGKDSTVLKHIVHGLYPGIKVVYIDTGLEYDSVRKNGIENSDVVLKPELSFVEVIKKYGYPVISKEVAQFMYEIQNRKLKGKEPPMYRIEKLKGTYIDKRTGELSLYNCGKYEFLLDAPFRISQYCCSVMKKNPAKHYEKDTGTKPFMGILANESRLRKQKWLKYGCNIFDEKRNMSNPLSFWTEQDILRYLKINNLEIPEIYGDIRYVDKYGMAYDENLFGDTMNLETSGVGRTGCCFCLFGITRDIDKFVLLKEQEPKKYDYIMRGGKFDEHGMWIPDRGLGYKFVIDWLNEHGNMGIRY